MHPPLPIEQLKEEYELATRLGSQRAAAEEMGIHPVTFSRHMARYVEVTGLPPLSAPRRRQRPRPELVVVPTETSDLQDQLDVLVRRIVVLEEGIALLLARKPQKEGFVPSHRRLADGGLPINKQKRSFKRMNTERVIA